MKRFSKVTRKEFIEAVKSAEEPFDLLIIGGGINGAGVARDASSRGMRVVVVEERDFSEGTSSRSSKLIHGGIRYLENLEFGLVFEALRERSRLFEIAPYLVHPLRFFLPIYRGDKYGMFKIGMGMWLYDLLALFETPEMHKRFSAQETMATLGILNSKNLVGSYSYSDAYMDDDRLVIETLRSANEYGALAISHCRAENALLENGKISAVNCKDLISGENITIRARHIVSTVGVWTDELGSSILPDWKPIMRPSKGIHLTLPNSRLPLTDALVMTSSDQKRIVFAIPRHEMTIVGTTDTDYSGDLGNVHATREDVDYLLKLLAEYFPNAHLTQNDVIGSYAGVRPLVRDSSTSEGKTSREHTIFSDPRGITFVAGGKYTTYRAMAEEAVEKVLKTFPVGDRVAFKNSKSREPLNQKASVLSPFACQGMRQGWSEDFGIPLTVVDQLIQRHGEETGDILAEHGFSSLRNQQLKNLANRSLYLEIEARHAIEKCMCYNLKDFYLRRVPLFLAVPDHGLSELDHLSEVFASTLTWSDSEAKSQKKSFEMHVENELSWRRIISPA